MIGDYITVTEGLSRAIKEGELNMVHVYMLVVTHMKSAWSMSMMNCRERLQCSIFAVDEGVWPRLPPVVGPDFSVRMCATF